MGNKEPEVPKGTETSECFGKAFEPTDEECKNCEVSAQCQEVMKTGKKEPAVTPEKPTEEKVAKKEKEKEKEKVKERRGVKEPVKEEKKLKKVRKVKVAKGKGPVKEKDDYGFVVGSRKSYIASLLKNSPTSKEQLLSKVVKKFGSAKMGVVDMALTQLKKRTKLKVEEGKYSI